MSELPLAPLKRIMNDNGAERVSEDGLKAFSKAVIAYAKILAQESAKTAKYAGRKTVKESDIEFSLE